LPICVLENNDMVGRVVGVKREAPQWQWQS